MKLARQFILAGVFICYSVPVPAQLLPWPTDPEGYPYRVDSAYGPRNVNRGTFFHKGLDLNEQNTGGANGEADINQPVIAPSNGTIFGIGRTNDKIAWIGVDYNNRRTFAYLHIFPNNEAAVVGNFSDVVSNPIAQNNQIRSYKRTFTRGDFNEGIILFYSGPVSPQGKNTGRIVKVLGIDSVSVHKQLLQISAWDSQDITLNTPTASENTVVVSAGLDGVLETMPQGTNVYSQDKMSILAGPDKKCLTKAGYVVPQTSVVSGEIIAPLGRSGTNNAHLHLQISHADEKLANDPSAGTDYNDGMNNVIQYLVRDHSQFSGDTSVSGDNSTVYHTDNHNNERVTASIRWRPEGADWQIYHPYELDRIRIMAIPSDVIQDLTPADAANNTYLINSNRDVQETLINELPDPADPFRAEFNYGGEYYVDQMSSPPLERDNAFPPFLSNTGVKFRSDGIRTGLNPLGDLVSMPGTEFVFNQWNTRIRKDFAGVMPPELANHNEDAAYPDGQYGLVAVAESVDREESERFISEPTFITVDNFRPYVKQVEVKRGDTTVYKRSWELERDPELERDILRSYAPAVETPLVTGEYTVITTFSEPMFEVSLAGASYAFSPYTSVLISTLTIGAYTQDAILPLEIRGSDIAGAANSILAVAPDRPHIDPARELTRDASGYMQGVGGPDKFHSLRVEAAPPVIEYENRNNTLAYSCGGNTCGTQTEPINLVWNQVHFKYQDVGSGIRDIIIYNAAGDVARVFSYEPRVYEQEIRLDLPDGLYRQVVTDNANNPTTMWFRVDPDSPRLNISAIDMSSDFNTFTASGTVRDTGSGMDFFRLSRGPTLITDFGVTRGSRELINFISPPLSVDNYTLGEAYYVFSAQDKAGNGSFQQPQFQFFKMPGVAAEQTNAIASYISEVRADGEACEIKMELLELQCTNVEKIVLQSRLNEAFSSLPQVRSILSRKYCQS